MLSRRPHYSPFTMFGPSGEFAPPVASIPRRSVFDNPNPQPDFAVPAEVERRIYARVDLAAESEMFRGCKCMRYVTTATEGRGLTTIQVNGVKYAVQRTLYQLVRGTLAPGRVLYRACRNPYCVQPYHFQLDVPKGRRGGKRTLTVEQARAAVAALDAGETKAAVGRRLGVSEATIRNTLKRTMSEREPV